MVYLNTGTYGLMPEPALRALVRATEALEQHGVAAPPDIGQAGEEARRRTADLIGGRPEEVAFTRNATDGINLVLAGLDWQPGDEVITGTEEHEALWHPLLGLSRKRGVRVVRVQPTPNASEMVERLDRAASRRTRLLAMSHVSCETGTRIAAGAACSWAAARGVRSLVDGAQSVGAVPVDVSEIGCDFLAGNGHKWLGGPKGFGFFWVRSDRVAELWPAHIGAGSLERADFHNAVAEPWSTAARFEYGTRPWALAVGFNAAISWLEQIGWARVQERIEAQTRALKSALAQLPGARVLTPSAFAESSGLVSVTLEGRDAGALCAGLAERGIHVRHVPRLNAVRASCAVFTNGEDLGRFVSALAG